MSPDKPQRRHLYRHSLMNSVKWDSFQPRHDDIIITTSYKAGTTWMQGICSALVFQQTQPPVHQDELTPWFDSNFGPFEDVLEKVEGLQSRRYLKTHCPMTGIKFFDEVKYIYVGRDGRDVFYSMWNHMNNMRAEAVDMLNNAPDQQGPKLPYNLGEFPAAFDEWLSRGSFDWELDGYPFWSHFQHAQSWWDYRHLPNILFVHFNDLLKDTDAEMRRISAYLDIPVNEAIWSDLVDSVAFKEMKANAENMAPGSQNGAWKNSSNFFRGGTNQRWLGLLSEEQRQRYDALAQARMTPELAEWLEYGSR